MSGTSPETSARSGDQWTLAYDEYRPEDERLREALCAVGNRYFVTRGACAQSSADRVHYLGTYLAGRFNRLASTIAGRVVESEDLVNLPVWLLSRLASTWVRSSTLTARFCCSVDKSSISGRAS